MLRFYSKVKWGYELGVYSKIIRQDNFKVFNITNLAIPSNCKNIVLNRTKYSTRMHGNKKYIAQYVSNNGIVFSVSK